MQDDRFNAVEMFLRMMKARYQSEQVKADTEFETIWRTAQREAKIEQVDNLIINMIEEASKYDD